MDYVRIKNIDYSTYKHPHNIVLTYLSVKVASDKLEGFDRIIKWSQIEEWPKIIYIYIDMSCDILLCVSHNIELLKRDVHKYGL